MTQMSGSMAPLRNFGSPKHARNTTRKLGNIEDEDIKIGELRGVYSKRAPKT